jgi:hypothetical protein
MQVSVEKQKRQRRESEIEWLARFTTEAVYDLNDAISGRLQYIYGPKSGNLRLHRWTIGPKSGRAVCGARCRDGRTGRRQFARDEIPSMKSPS